MKTGMPGKVWITGASSGIGKALALRYASEGAVVAVSARSKDTLDKISREAGEMPGKIIPFPLDITDADACMSCFSEIEQAFGIPDLVILSAGTFQPVGADDFDARLVNRQMQVNFEGTVNCLGPVIRAFIKRSAGHIAIVSSVSGYCGLPYAAPYGASKAALINLCEALKPELDRAGVSLTVINPGFVKTPLTDKNDFPMPFLMDLDAAVERIYTGLQKRPFELAFPRRLVWAMKLLATLPYTAFFAVTRRMLRPQVSRGR